MMAPHMNPQDYRAKDGDFPLGRWTTETPYLLDLHLKVQFLWQAEVCVSVFWNLLFNESQQKVNDSCGIVVA